MRTRYTREQLMKYSNDEILKNTKNMAIDFHLNNSHWLQLCVNDLHRFDCANGCFYTRTDIKIRFQDVDYIEIFG